jgi:hypothetical protein
VRIRLTNSKLAVNLESVASRPVFGDGGAASARASCGHASFLLGLSSSAPFKVALLATVDLLGLLSRRGRAYALWRRGLAEALHALGGLLGGRFSVWGRLLHAHLVPARLGVLTHVARARLLLRARGRAALHRLRGGLRLLGGLLLLGRGKTGPGHQREGGDTGMPIVISDPDAPAAEALREAARAVVRATKSKVGKPLTLMAAPGAPVAAGHDHAGHSH